MANNDSVMGSNAITEGDVDSTESGESGGSKTHADNLISLAGVVLVGAAMALVAVVGWLTAA